jgi:glucokinase
MDIGGTKIAVGFLDENGKLQGFKKVNTAKIFALKEDAAEALQVFLADYIDEIGVSPDQVQGVGIGVPSVLDSHTQEVVSTPYIPKLNNYPLSLLLAPKLGLPVIVENDVNLIAVGEHLHGRGKGLTDVACVFVGTGLGCGLILNNHLYTGADGAAAEFGHLIYDHQGRLCGCGATGCFEAYCSGVGLTTDAKQIFSQAEIDAFFAQGKKGQYALAELLIRSAREGHPQAKEAIDKAFFILGLAVTNLVNLINPQLVILGGGIVSGWPEALEIVRGVVQEKARSVTKNRVVIDYPILKDKAGLYGAASLVHLSLENN